MIRPVIVYPNKILRQVSEAVDIGELTGEELATLVRDLRETVVAANGASIAAIQVGVPKRVVVVHPEMAGTNPDVLINPQITACSDATEAKVEGCLSMPGIRAVVVRHTIVTLEALTMTGEKVEFTTTGPLAQALAHELEHLDGVLMVDKVKPVKKEMINRRMSKHAGESILYRA